MNTTDQTETKTRAGVLGTFLGYIKERRVTVGNSLHITASQVNARPLVQPALYGPSPGYNGNQGGTGPGMSPDPIRQSMFDGIGHIGIARIPKWASFYDQTAWEAQSFVGNPNLDYVAGASIIQGRQTPVRQRVNIQVPEATAYGSMFEYQSLPYGYVG